MPCGQLRLDIFFGEGFSFKRALLLFPPVAPRDGHIPRTINILSNMRDWRRKSFRISGHAVKARMSRKPKQHPDRRTAEGEKPNKRKPDKQCVSVHGRFCQMMLGLAAKYDARRHWTCCLNSRIQSCPCVPIIWLFAPKATACWPVTRRCRSWSWVMRRRARKCWDFSIPRGADFSSKARQAWLNRI
jgi:hypothetical protein